MNNNNISQYVGLGYFFPQTVVPLCLYSVFYFLVGVALYPLYPFFLGYIWEVIISYWWIYSLVTFPFFCYYDIIIFIIIIMVIRIILICVILVFRRFYSYYSRRLPGLGGISKVLCFNNMRLLLRFNIGSARFARWWIAFVLTFFA